MRKLKSLAREDELKFVEYEIVEIASACAAKKNFGVFFHAKKMYYSGGVLLFEM